MNTISSHIKYGSMFSLLKALAKLVPALLIPLLLSSCGDNIVEGLKPGANNITLSVSLESGAPLPEILTLGSANASVSIDVRSNTVWKVTASNSWCAIEGGEGTRDGIFTISPGPNTSKEARDCVVAITAVDAEGNAVEGANSYINVRQEGQSVSISPADVDVLGPEEQLLKFTISANQPYRVTLSGDTDFMSLASGEAEITSASSSTNDIEIKVARNMTGSVRRGSVTLSSPTDSFIPISVAVAQNGQNGDLLMSPEGTKNIGVATETFDITLRSIYDWQIIFGADWITLSYTEEGAMQTVTGRGSIVGKGSADFRTIRCTVATNTTPGGEPRRATLQVEASNGAGLDLKIVQESPAEASRYFEVSPQGLDVVEASGASDIPVSITSTMAWEIKTPDWISASRSFGDAGQTTVLFNVAPNESRNNREGLIIIDNGTNSEVKSIPLVQLGRGDNVAVSTPWLGLIWTNTSMTIECNYLSPVKSVQEAGIEWRKASDSSWSRTPYATGISAGSAEAHNGSVSVLLTNLESDTEYEVRGYVLCDGSITYSAETVTVRSAGMNPGGVPGADDNNPPAVTFVRRRVR